MYWVSNMSDFQIIGISFSVVILIIIFLIWKNYRSTDSHKYFPKVIRKISKFYMKNVVIPDAVEGSTFIDWLVLTPRGILIISQKPYKGLIFGAENISHWTQVIDRRSYNFENPLRQLEVDVVTIKSIVPGVPVKAYVVFDRDSFFPKGKPKIVLTLNEIKQNISVFREGTISPELKAAWDKLQEELLTARGAQGLDTLNTSSNFG